METSTIIIILVVTGLVCGAYSAFVAGEKGYSSVAWFFGGFFCGIFALIAAVGLPVKTTSTPQSQSKENPWKCPKCGFTNAGWDKICQNKVQREDGVKVWCHTPRPV